MARGRGCPRPFCVQARTARLGARHALRGRQEQADAMHDGLPIRMDRRQWPGAAQGRDGPGACGEAAVVGLSGAVPANTSGALTTAC